MRLVSAWHAQEIFDAWLTLIPASDGRGNCAAQSVWQKALQLFPKHPAVAAVSVLTAAAALVFACLAVCRWARSGPQTLHQNIDRYCRILWEILLSNIL